MKKVGIFILILFFGLQLFPGCASKSSENEKYTEMEKQFPEVDNQAFGLIYELEDSTTGYIRDEIIESLKVKQVIGVGESTHGTKEFNDLKISILQSFLKKNVPINILLEITIPEGQVLHNFITNNTVELQWLHQIHNPLLKNSSFKFLLEECRRANQNKLHKNKIKIYGIDPSYDKSLIDHLNEAISSSEIDSTIPNELREYFKNLKFTELIDVSIGQRDSIKGKILELKEVIPVDTDIKILLSIEQFLQAIKRLEMPIYSTRSLNIRDSSMASNIEKIIKNDTSRYNIIFAHNEHISISTSNNLKTMGWFLNDSFKENYYPIAVDFIQGTYRVNANKSTRTIFSKNNDTLLKQILQDKISPVYIRTDHRYFDRETKLHAIGAQFRSVQFKNYNLMTDFSAIILYKDGTPTQEIIKLPF